MYIYIYIYTFPIISNALKLYSNDENPMKSKVILLTELYHNIIS